MSAFYHRLFILVILLLLVPLSALAQQHNFPQLQLRGTHNAWSTTPMTLVANNEWAATVNFGTAANERFKFDVFGNWSQNYGDSNSDGTAERNGGDIFITQGAGAYRITFNDSNLRYTVSKQSSANQVPRANAGADFTVALGETAQFDGGASFDPDGSIASYSWSNGMSGSRPTYVYNAAGSYTVTLTVTDNAGATASDSVVVTVTDPNSRLSTFNQMHFRGTANNWAAGAMTLVADYTWQIEATFSGASNDRFKFDVLGDWSHNYGDNNNDGIAERTGNDIVVRAGAGNYRIVFNDSTRAYSVTKLAQSNQAPVANAGADITAVAGDNVRFDGSASIDPDGTILSYAWSNGLTGVSPSTIYNTAGVFDVTLTVTDNMGATATDTVRVTVSERNTAYRSNFAQLHARGTFNAWAATPMALVEDFTWQLIVEFSGASNDRLKFDVLGDWSHNYGDNNNDGIAERTGGDILIREGQGTYRLRFNDSDRRYSVVRIGDLNVAPIADAGPDQVVDVGASFTLDGSHSTDLDGEIVGYVWSTGATTAQTSHRFDSAGEYTITLTVTDNEGASDSDSVRILVADLTEVPSECFTDISFLGDQDQDGLPDCAELPGVVYRENYYFNLGARTDRPDLFVEVDWMNASDLGIIPQREAMEKVVAAFAKENIGIHFDTGPLFHPAEGISPEDFDLGGGNAMPFVKTIHLGFNGSDPTVVGLLSLKQQHMSALRRNGPWYYMIFGSSQRNDGLGGSSGVAEINGKNSIITLGSWGLGRFNETSTNLLINYQAGTVMHEFGHVLGLRHGGFENTNRKPNYLSVMSYDYQLDGLPTIGNREGDRALRRLHGYTCVPNFTNPPGGSYHNFVIDYSHGLSVTLYENGVINEAVGYGHANSQAIDWNCDGDVLDQISGMQLNSDGFSEALMDHDDWGNIRYYYYNNPVSADVSSVEPPVDSEQREISEEEAPPAEVFERIRNAR